MPLCHLLPRLANHVIPMSRLHGATSCAKNYFPYQLIASKFIKVHHTDVHACFADLLPRNLENESLVVDGIQGPHLDVCFLLLSPSRAVRQPDLHVGVCGYMENKLDVLALET